MVQTIYRSTIPDLVSPRCPCASSNGEAPSVTASANSGCSARGHEPCGLRTQRHCIWRPSTIAGVQDVCDSPARDAMVWYVCRVPMRRETVGLGSLALAHPPTPPLRNHGTRHQVQSVAYCPRHCVLESDPLDGQSEAESSRPDLGALTPKRPVTKARNRNLYRGRMKSSDPLSGCRNTCRFSNPGQISIPANVPRLAAISGWPPYQAGIGGLKPNRNSSSASWSPVWPNLTIDLVFHKVHMS